MDGRSMFNRPVMSPSLLAALQLHHERQAALARADVPAASVLTRELDLLLTDLAAALEGQS